MNAGWSADNLTFGSGGGLLQDCNRDTERMAMKCSHVVVNGIERDVHKKPATDPTKDSKRGRLSLVFRDGRFQTVPEVSDRGEDLLVPVFRNGQLLVDHTLEDVRQRAVLH